MSDEYTPTTEWVRIMVGYAKTIAVDQDRGVEAAREEGYAWFDRWLAVVIADANSEASILVTKMTGIAAEQTARALRAEAKLKAVRDAWNVEGPSPTYHWEAKRRLFQEWPTLAKAVRVIAEHDGTTMSDEIAWLTHRLLNDSTVPGLAVIREAIALAASGQEGEDHG